MFKRIVCIGLLLMVCLGCLAGCEDAKYFKSLEALQKVMPDDVFYFDFAQEGVTEAGKYKATRNKRDDGSYWYYRYTIWYNVEYKIDGKAKKRKLIVIATSNMRSIGPSSRDYPLKFVGLNTNEVNHEFPNYYYYFRLENVKTITQEEKEYLVSICEQAIANRYRYNQN